MRRKRDRSIWESECLVTGGLDNHCHYQKQPSPWKLKEAFRKSWIVFSCVPLPLTPTHPFFFNLTSLRVSHQAGSSETWLYLTSRTLFWRRSGKRSSLGAGCTCWALTPECTTFWVWTFADSKAVSYKVRCCPGTFWKCFLSRVRAEQGSPTWRMNASFSCFVDLSPPFFMNLSHMCFRNKTCCPPQPAFCLVLQYGKPNWGLGGGLFSAKETCGKFAGIVCIWAHCSWCNCALTTCVLGRWWHLGEKRGCIMQYECSLVCSEQCESDKDGKGVLSALQSLKFSFLCFVWKNLASLSHLPLNCLYPPPKRLLIFQPSVMVPI